MPNVQREYLRGVDVCTFGTLEKCHHFARQARLAPHRSNRNSAFEFFDGDRHYALGLVRRQGISFAAPASAYEDRNAGLPQPA